MFSVDFFIVIISAYLLGSIPTAVWWGKFLTGVDIRTIGSGNAGFTNTIRLCGFKKAIPVFIVDTLKGTCAILIAKKFFPETEIVHILSAIVVIIGHLYPIFAGFKGGKGVLASLGAVIGIYPVFAGISMIGFFAVFFKTRIVSASSLTAAVILSICAITDYIKFHKFIDGCEYLVFAIFLTTMVFYTHRKNISRLLKGEESSFKKTPKDTKLKEEENDK